MENDLIRKVFKNTLEEELLQQMEQKGRIVTYKEGEELLTIGTIVKFIPVILEGSFKVTRNDEDGRELLLYVVNASESCAMMFTCCMEQFPSEVRAVAETDCTVVLVPITVMDEWMMKYVTWKSYIMRTIRNKFNQMMQIIDQLAFLNLDERLEHYLKQKVEHTGSSQLQVSHQEIADELATSRVVISRVLKKLELEKKVVLSRSQIKVLM